MLRALCLAVLLSIFAVAQDKRQDRKPEVHLNHAFIVPDAETYEAIRNSDFVKQFALWEERTTHRKDITYTGFYLYGRHTYFEFLKPDERTPAGTSEIAFGVDRTGDLDLLQKRAEAAGIKTEIKTITRAFNGKDVDWFRSLDTKDEDKTILGIWTLEYVPTFLNEWHPKSGGKSGVRREDVLRRYAEVVKQEPQDKLMEDITSMAVRLPDRRQALKESCSSAQAISEIGRSAECAWSDFTITLSLSDEPAQICAVTFSMRHLPKQSAQKTPHRYELGKTTLTIFEHSARWDFCGNPAHAARGQSASLAP